MNPTNESFDFTGGWQDDIFVESPSYLDAPFAITSSGHIDAAGFYHEPGAASSPDDWIPGHSPWLQHSSTYVGSSSADVEYSPSFPSYTTAQGYVYDGTTGELSDVDQCNSHSSFSESDFDHLYAANRNNPQSRSFPQAPISSAPNGNFQHHLRPLGAQTSLNDLPAQFPSLPHLAHSDQPSQLPRLHIPPSVPNLSPNDPLHPRQQSSRWIGDLYTPTYVRGDGSNRAGWCGHCASWLTLKDSAYWYHMHFAHGISCATGAYLPNPARQRPTLGAARGVGDTEALCGGCSRWVLVVAGEKGRTAWYRRAYRCLLKAPAARERRRGKSASPRKVAARPVMGGPAGPH